MNKIYLLFLCGSFSGLAQVGINTTSPSNTLDINGGIRIRDTKYLESEQRMTAVKVMGLDVKGNVMELQLDDNLYLEDNVIKYSISQEQVYSPPNLNRSVLNNAVGIVLPGGTGRGRTVRLVNSAGDVSFTGIDISVYDTPLDAHGVVVSLYSVSGEIEIKSEDTGSLPENRFLLSDGSTLKSKQYNTLKLMYDGILQRWLVISRH